MPKETVSHYEATESEQSDTTDMSKLKSKE